MPYVKRTVVCGRVTEIKKMFTPRIHTAGAPRGKIRLETEEAQAAVNERKAEERLRWKLNANFDRDDLHCVLHYSGEKPENIDEINDELRKFLRVLRAEAKKAGTELRYVACTETKRMTNPHHHIIINQMDVRIITNAWEKVTGSGRVSFKPLDSRGNHEELAAYLIKETRSTLKRKADGQKNKKRFSCSQNLIMPEPVYTVIPAKGWKKEPAPQRGFYIFKHKNGETIRSGIHEVSGYGWQEYFEIKQPEIKAKFTKGKNFNPLRL